LRETARVPSERTTGLSVFSERLLRKTRVGGGKDRPPSEDRATNATSRVLPPGSSPTFFEAM
jgi:hypothetical protein